LHTAWKLRVEKNRKPAKKRVSGKEALPGATRNIKRPRGTAGE
jgi:hypothetical protein